jgi:hypothetical protein
MVVRQVHKALLTYIVNTKFVRLSERNFLEFAYQYNQVLTKKLVVEKPMSELIIGKEN